MEILEKNKNKITLKIDDNIIIISAEKDGIYLSNQTQGKYLSLIPQSSNNIQIQIKQRNKD